MGKTETVEKIITQPTTLSDSQKSAVLSNSRHIRIVAGAGAGKTETLTRKIVYLLLSEKVEPSQIVAFTFTEKAAQSMKSRVYERVKALGGEDACSRLGDMYIGTIHGYCFRLLDEHYGYGNYGVFDENQEMAFIFRMGWSLKLGHLGKRMNYADSCKTFLDTINVVYSEMLSKEILERRDVDFYRSLLAYEKYLDKFKRLTFNRMVSLAINNIEKDSSPLSSVKYLIVDEYQDINRAQEHLINLIGKDASIFIVGDPRQTIYQWRGSDEKCFDDFVNHYPDTETINILENRRSGKRIIEAANYFSDSFETAKYSHLNPTKDEDGLVVNIEHETDIDEASWIADQIQRLTDTKGLSFGDIGILVRSVTTSAPPFIEIFRNRGIPFIIGGKVGLFRRPEAQAIGMLFSWLSSDGFWVPNPWSWKEKITGDDLLLEGVSSWHLAIPSFSINGETYENLRSWKRNVLSSKYEHFTESFFELLVLLGYLDLDPTVEEDAVLMSNLGRLSSLLFDYESSSLVGGKKRDWEKNMKGLCWYLNSYASTSYEEPMSDDIRSNNAVQLMTIHQAKGLEWPVVFMPALVSKRFPSSMTGSERDWFISRNIFDVSKYEGTLEDERRLFYVALTRAKDIAVLSCFKRKSKLFGKCDFLDNLPKISIKDISHDDNLPEYNFIKKIDTEEILTFYTGEIIAYQKCPHYYRLREVWNYNTGLRVMYGYGNALHDCLRHAALMIKNENYDVLSAMVTSVRRNFFMPYVSESIMESIKKGAEKTLLGFVKKHEEDMKRIHEVEARLEFPLQRATVTGKIDVILHDDELYEIRDYKTSDTVTTFEESALQINTYALGLKIIGMPISKGSLSYLEDNTTNNIEINQEILNNTQEKIEKHIECILNKKFSATPGEFCSKCDYKRVCRWAKNE